MEQVAEIRLQHPSVVTIYHIGVEGNTPYIVMELVEGNTLKKIIGGRPMAGIYRLLYGAHARQAFESNPLPLYYLGRGLSIVYAVLSLPFTFLVGRRVFGERVGLVGVALFALYPLALTHAQVARTDSAAVFWGMVSLWRIFELRQAPSLKNQLMAGAVIGLSISSRFFMLTLVPLLLVVDVLLISQASTRDKNAWLGAGAGLLTVTMAFVLTSPYLFLDINTALVSLRAGGNV